MEKQRDESAMKYIKQGCHKAQLRYYAKSLVYQVVCSCAVNSKHEENECKGNSSEKFHLYAFVSVSCFVSFDCLNNNELKMANVCDVSPDGLAR